MFATHLAGAIPLAPRSRLDQLAAIVWRAHAAGHLDDEQAQAAAEAIAARKSAEGGRLPYRAPQNNAPAATARARYQRSPDRQRSIERRRRLAASGPMPPALAARFTVGQLAVLRIVADEVKERGRCDRCLDALAARAGTCRRLAQGALREAERLGMIRIEERRLSAWRNDPNVVTITSPEWRTWLRLDGGGGCKNPPSTASRIQPMQNARQTSRKINQDGASLLASVQRDDGQQHALQLATGRNSNGP